MPAIGIVVRAGVLGLALLLAPTQVLAGPSDALEEVSVLTLDGRIVIEPDGVVSDVTVETKLTPALAEVVKRHVAGWRFRPVLVDGVAKRASTALRLGLAGAGEGGELRIWVDSVSFPDYRKPTALRPDGELEPITGRVLRPPGYPPGLQQRGMMGTVLLAIRVTPEGKVGDVVAVQSMAYLFNKPAGLNPRALEVLEANAINAARRWSFNVPNAASRTPGQLTVTVPVQYDLGYVLEAPGQWLRVKRTAKRPIGWLPPKPGGIGLGVANSSGSSLTPYGEGPTLLQDVAGTTLL